MTQFASRGGSPDVVIRASNCSVMTDIRPVIEFDESSKVATGAAAGEIYLKTRRLDIVRKGGTMS